MFLKQFFRVLVICIVLVGNVAVSHAYHVQVSSKNTSARFSIYCLGYGNIKGKFNRFGGSINIQRARPQESKVTIVIDTKSLQSSSYTVDTFLRGAELLAVTKFPKAVFESTAVTILKTNAAIVVGHLTLRGVTRPMTIRSTVVRGPKQRIKALKATMSFRLSDFGMNALVDLLSTKIVVTILVENH